MNGVPVTGSAAIPGAAKFRRPATFDPFEVDRLEDAELDELAFGVICLAADGTILRYNAAEARLARLDRHTVIGRTFFGEVAPCTDGPEFRGRFEALVGGEVEGDVIRFPFRFDFKHGSQQVSVEMLRAAETQRYYLLINRLSFGPLPDDVDDLEPAPRQSELLPPTAEPGVQRGAREQRVIHAPILLFDALMRTCDRVAPETWAIFCREWGTQWGRRAVVDLETACLEETQQTLRDRPMREVAERIATQMLDEGWGRLSFDLRGAESSGALRLELHDSALVAASRRSPARRCALLGGMLEAVLSHLADRRLHVEEVACAAAGAPCCKFFVVGRTRAETVAEMAARGDSAQQILHALTDQDDAG